MAKGLVEIELVALVTDLKTLETSALVCFECFGEALFFIAQIEEPEQEADA